MQRYAGSFRTRTEAIERRRWLDGELAAMPLPDVSALEREPVRAPTLADAVAAYRASRIDIAEATRVNIGTSLNLIVGALDDGQLARFEQRAREFGLAVLVEVHHAGELARALTPATPLIGINNRNLKTFNVSLSATLDLLPKVPAGRRVVTESGISLPKDVALMRSRGVQAFLVGEAFMRVPDPGAGLKALFG